MKTRVTDEGLLIPRSFLLEGMDEVEIRKQENTLVVVPIRREDSILELGKQPVSLDVEDASLNHDQHLYPA